MPLTEESPHAVSTADPPRAALPRDEETINSITHGIGFILSVVGAIWLMTKVIEHGNFLQMVGCGVYATTLVAVYAASTLSHVFRRPRLRRLFRIVDQAFIFLLIAGTYTGFAFTYLDAGPWWVLTTLIWVIAWSGFISKLVFAHQIESVSTVLHVALGWLPVLCFKPIADLAPWSVLRWMLAGGICYTAGTIFLSRDERFPFFHAIWHVSVIAGSACHFWAVFGWCAGG
jgi:hemolysin III